MSKFKILLAVALVLVIVAFYLSTGRVMAGDASGGGGHGMLRVLL